MNEENKMADVINFDDFMKVDIRAGRIDAAERVPKSKKLLKLTVNFGSLGTRQILAGVGESYAPEDVIDKQAAFVVNLPPRKMMGLESHGMILAGLSLFQPTEGVESVSIVYLSVLIPAGTRLG